MMLISIAYSQSALEFRVTWLTDPNSPSDLGFNPDPDVHGTMGINNLGQVVYGYSPNSAFNNIRPFIWLPQAAYGLQYAGWHDMLDILDSQCSFTLPAIARDLNDDGVIVGQSDGIAGVVPLSTSTTSAGEATVWTISNGEACAELLGTLEGPVSGTLWSGAWAINNEQDPVVVGVSSIDRNCGCDGTGTIKRFYAGFSCRLDGSPSMDELDRFAGNLVNAALDIGTPSTGPAWIVGYSRCWDVSSCGQGGGDEGLNCHSLVYPAGWDEGDPDPVAVDRLASYAHIARGTNDDELTVGWGYSSSGPCFQSAVYWSAPNSPYNLGSIMPDGQEGDQSRAEAINNVQFPWAVGWNVDQQYALLWIKTGTGDGDWDAYDLNELLGSNLIKCNPGNPQSPWVPRWQIVNAHDVNDSHWIVATALNACISGIHAVLLTPIGTCPWDINQDGVVDEEDVNTLGISAGCNPSRICYEDVNNDGQVDSEDMKVLLDNFGECSGIGGGGSFAESYISYWVDAGGWDALRNEQITGSQIAEALSHSTETERIAALYSLLSQ